MALNEISDEIKLKKITDFQAIAKKQTDSKVLQTAISAALLKSNFVDKLKNQMDSMQIDNPSVIKEYEAQGDVIAKE